MRANADKAPPKRYDEHQIEGGAVYESYPIATQPPRERFGYFQATIERLFCAMQVLPRQPSCQSFDGIIEASALGSVRLAKVATTSCVVRRRPEDIARLSEAAYLVKFQTKGESSWTQRGREVHLRQGDFVVCSVAEPYRLEFTGVYEMPVLALSAETMRRLTPDPDRFIGMRMGAEDADCGLLSGFVAQVAARMRQLSEPMVARAEANVLDLLGAVLSTRGRAGRPTAEQLIGQIKVYIARHVRNSRLDAPTIAAVFGMSTRQVHALFEAEPLSLGRYIRHLRVIGCRRALEEGMCSRMSLTEVALEWGFYDLSHMTRCFRAEFGMTPGEVRAGLEGVAAIRAAGAPD